MDIYNLIDNAAYIAKCNSTEENKYIMALDKINFWDVYRELKFRDTFLIIDKKGNINFFIKLNDPTIIKNLLDNNKTSIYAEWNYYGPEIFLKIDGIERIPGFILELENNMDASILQKLLKNSEAFIQYIVQDEKGIIKLLTEKIKMDRNFIERLKYYIELDYYEKYPRIIDEDIYEKNGYYIKVLGEIKVLEEIMNRVSRLAALYTNEIITVHIKANDFYKIIFSGDIIIIKKIINEISNNVNIIEEGITEVRGKPFFKYSNGLLYFFEKSSREISKS